MSDDVDPPGNLVAPWPTTWTCSHCRRVSANGTLAAWDTLHGSLWCFACARTTWPRLRVDVLERHIAALEAWEARAVPQWRKRCAYAWRQRCRARRAEAWEAFATQRNAIVENDARASKLAAIKLQAMLEHHAKDSARFARDLERRLDWAIEWGAMLANDLQMKVVHQAFEIVHLKGELAVTTSERDIARERAENLAATLDEPSDLENRLSKGLEDARMALRMNAATIAALNETIRILEERVENLRIGALVCTMCKRPFTGDEGYAPNGVNCCSRCKG
jgi:hypothetical protein